MSAPETAPSASDPRTISEGLAFTKYHGLGNDFAIVELSALSSELGAELSDPRVVQRLCDRHYGIGADGVLLVTPGESVGARGRMTVLNSDGSRPEMCGNGLRCVALHLARRTGEPELRIDTDAGLRSCTVELEGNTGSVTAALGRAAVLGALEHSIDGERLALTHVSVGNPHAVVFDARYDEAQIDRLAPALSARFPGGVNVELVRPTSSARFEIVVWERGVGRTLACGTGAAAVAAAACHAGRAPFGQWVKTVLPGGTLEVRVHEGSFAVDQRGPAELVYGGTLPPLGLRSASLGLRSASGLDAGP